MARRWWGDSKVGVGEGATFHLGPLELHARRDARTWTLQFERTMSAPRDRVRVDVPASAPTFSPRAHLSRVAFRATNELLLVRPALPDRVLIVAPQIRFSVAPREDLTLFARVPVWMRIFAGDPPDVPALLREIMTVRLRDTWSGPTTRDGELGYATREDDFATPDESPPAAHEVVCPLRVNNRAPTLLALEEIRIPLPQLPLFADASGILWTPTVTLEREPDGDLAELRVAEEPPVDAVRVAEPRVAAERRRIVKVFGNLLRRSWEEHD